MSYRFILILLFSLFISLDAYSNVRENCVEPDKGFRNNAPGRGWFWGEKVCEPVKDNETEISNIENNEKQNKWKILPKTANIPWEILDTLDPDEIANKIEPEAKKVAVMYPTEENIMAYRKLSRWIMIKAKSYTMKDTQVRTENPSIAPEIVTANTSEFRRRLNYTENTKRRAGYLNEYKERARIVVYTRIGCSYCTAQKPILESFIQKHGWQVMERSVEENLDEQIKFNIEYTPDIFLLLNTPQGIKYQRIATGLTTLQDLEKQVVLGLEYLGENVSYLREVTQNEIN